jgi:hypothetical protein
MSPGQAILLAIPLYFWNFAPHPFKPGPGDSWLGWLADVPVWALLLALELIGAVIKPFALVMTFGILVGTFSSIFVASPVLLRITQRWAPNATPTRTIATPTTLDAERR